MMEFLAKSGLLAGGAVAVVMVAILLAIRDFYLAGHKVDKHIADSLIDDASATRTWPARRDT